MWIFMDMKPFVKWVGGKRDIFDQIYRYFPFAINRYYEPFVGGGSVFISMLNSNRSVNIEVNDINSDLILTYKVIKDDVDNLLKFLELLQTEHDEHGKKYYLDARLWDKAENYSRLHDYVKAGRFIFLNKTCFNGLYRVNRWGRFNVPYGNREGVKIHDKRNIIALHHAFNDNDIKFHNQSYGDFLENCGDGDFVFLDPPYDKEKQNSFTKYSKGDFTRKDQEKLADFLDILHNKGVKFLMTNFPTDYIKNRYCDYEMREIEVQRKIKRISSKDIIIKNY